MWLVTITLAAVGEVPRPISIEATQDHYFGADAYTSAEYLHLAADGRYAVVDVEHMFTEVGDTGRWQVRAGRVVLESERSVRDIDLGEFKVFVFDRCGQETLPELRGKIAALIEEGGRIAPAVLDRIAIRRKAHPLGRDPEGFCGASLSYSPDKYPPRPVPAKRLDAVLAAIDAWLAEEDTQHVFEYQAWEHQGERFLVPTKPGMHAVQQSAEEVRDQMDRSNGQRAPYVYYAIPAQEHARRTNCTYPFKFATEMNRPCNAE